MLFESMVLGVTMMKLSSITTSRGISRINILQTSKLMFVNIVSNLIRARTVWKHMYLCTIGMRRKLT